MSHGAHRGQWFPPVMTRQQYQSTQEQATGLGEDIDENDANWFFQLSPSQRTDEDYEWYHAGNHYRKRCSPHEWVNISLMNEKLVCKKCDCDYDEKTHASRK